MDNNVFQWKTFNNKINKRIYFWVCFSNFSNWSDSCCCGATLPVALIFSTDIICVLFVSHCLDPSTTPACTVWHLMCLFMEIMAKIWTFILNVMNSMNAVSGTSLAAVRKYSSSQSVMDSASLLGAAESMRRQPYFPAGANLWYNKLVIVSIWSIAIIWLWDAVCTQIFLHHWSVRRFNQSKLCEKSHKKVLFVLFLFCIAGWQADIAVYAKEHQKHEK